jgi:hypothetical protein
VAAPKWMTIELVLVSGRGETLDPPPGRVFAVSPKHTLADLADAVNVAFARWDLSHLHVFRFDDGIEYMPDGSEFDPAVRDSDDVSLSRPSSSGVGARSPTSTAGSRVRIS